jgi:hypothetical protein
MNQVLAPTGVGDPVHYLIERGYTRCPIAKYESPVCGPACQSLS